jgi:hypothetical protein
MYRSKLWWKALHDVSDGLGELIDDKDEERVVMYGEDLKKARKILQDILDKG